MMSFIQVSIITSQEFAEIFTAELAEIGFDTFEETDEGVNAFIPKENFKETDLREVIDRYALATEVSHTISEIERQNWNEEWEKNYDPIEVEGKCRIRATFHKPDLSFEYEIIVTPKMSFGTGHHATTYNMIRLEMGFDFNNKSVLDVGTGTGILAIMAAKLGAANIECTDIDEWCIENSAENFQLNGLDGVTTHQGVITEVPLTKSVYDVVLANINKNILLDEIRHYVKLIKSDGVLFLSGFYENDIADIENEASKYNLSLQETVIRDKWVAMKMSKC